MTKVHGFVLSYFSIGSLIVATRSSSEQVEQLNHRGEGSRHVRKRSSGEYLLGAAHLLSAHTRFLDIAHAATACIDLDRQGNDLEENGEREEPDGKRGQARKVQCNAEDKDDRQAFWVRFTTGTRAERSFIIA